MAAELGLTIEVSLHEVHRLPLASVIPGFARHLTQLLERHAVPHTAVWSGGSRRRIAAEVSLPSSVDIGLLAEILPGFLKVALTPPSPFPKPRSDANVGSAVHSLMVCLDSRVLPLRWGQHEAVGTARGATDPARIDWSSDGNYRHALRAVNVELDLAERKRNLLNELDQRVTLPGSQFRPPVELLGSWVEAVEAPRFARFQLSPSNAEVPLELFAEVAMKHRCVALDVADEEGAVQLLALLDVSEDVAGKQRALEVEWAAACEHYASDFSLDVVSQPGGMLGVARTVAFGSEVSGLETLCRSLAAELGLAAQVLQRSLQAAAYVRLPRNSAVVAAFPRLSLVVVREAARRLGAGKDTLELLTSHAAGRFQGPSPGRPELDAAALLFLADNLDQVLTAAERGALPAGPSDPHSARAKGVALLHTLLERAWPVGIARLVSVASVDRDFENGLSATAASERVIGFLRHRMRVLLGEAVVGGVTSVTFDGDWDSPVFRRRQLKSPA